MPPKFKFTRAEMTAAALDVTREKGITGLTARSLAARLGCSVKPVFGLFENMEEVQREVIAAANALYLNRINSEIAAGKYPPYKASGMAYIRFAREERELFKLLFMRDRSGEKIDDGREPVQPQIDQIREATGLGEEEAYRFHIEMWIYVHGIATMIATSYLDWNMEFIEQALTDEYIGLKYRFCQAENQKGAD